MNTSLTTSSLILTSALSAWDNANQFGFIAPSDVEIVKAAVALGIPQPKSKRPFVCHRVTDLQAFPPGHWEHFIKAAEGFAAEGIRRNELEAQLAQAKNERAKAKIKHKMGGVTFVLNSVRNAIAHAQWRATNPEAKFPPLSVPRLRGMIAKATKDNIEKSRMPKDMATLTATRWAMGKVVRAESEGEMSSELREDLLAEIRRTAMDVLTVCCEGDPQAGYREACLHLQESEEFHRGRLAQERRSMRVPKTVEAEVKAA